MLDVSVVICTRNRVGSLGPALDTIAAAYRNVGHRTVELILVDNGSTDGTGELVQDWAAGAPFPVHLIREDRPGLAHARNVGLERAQGRIIAFTDDDCRMAPDYLVQLFALTDGVSVPAIWGGRVNLGDPEDMPYTIKTDPNPAIYNGARHPGGFIHGCNMVMTRATIVAVGVFDERFGAGTPFESAEDTDYFYRAYLAGAQVAYVPSLVVAHFHGRKTRAEILKLTRIYARGNGALYVKHARHWNLLRNLYWDLKGSLREMTGGKPYDPVFGFTYRENLGQCLRGMQRFVIVALRDMAGSGRHHRA